MLGKYENFPTNIHRIESFDSSLTSKQLQQRLIQVLSSMNRKSFDFEEVANPTIPNCEVIFEFGLAEDNGFTFIDEEETKKTLDALKNGHLQTIDFFCAIRYYKINAEKKTPLKFDYYLIRTIFGNSTVEFQIAHQRGPRYLSPEDLTALIFNKINETSPKKVLRKTEHS